MYSYKTKEEKFSHRMSGFVVKSVYINTILKLEYAYWGQKKINLN